MVHFDGVPKSQMKAESVPPRMTMAERLQKRLDAEAGSTAEAPSQISNPEEDRLSAMIKGVNEKTVPQEAAEPVSEQSAEEKEREEKLEYARLYHAAAMRAREKKIVDQRSIAEARARLMQLPSVQRPNDLYARRIERAVEPMPTVDNQKVYETDYGPLMILSIDADTRTMYFATPDERRRVDAALVNDEHQSSMGAADFTHVVALSPDQARKFLQFSAEAAPRDRVERTTERISEAPAPLQNRYASAA